MIYAAANDLRVHRAIRPHNEFTELHRFLCSEEVSSLLLEFSHNRIFAARFDDDGLL
ncbi:hypothetical protein D3C80_2235570 [compost metagenome]